MEYWVSQSPITPTLHYSNTPVFDHSSTPTLRSLRQGADLDVCAAQATGEFPRDIEN